MLKSLIKSIIPESVLQKRRRRIAEREQKRFADKSVAETFREIYEKNIWGGDAGEFYSGAGSAEKYAAEYAAMVRKFINENQIKKVVDFGCGDFRVAARFITSGVKYAGVDIVPAMIEHHNKNYASADTEFFCLNIIEDKLPDGDLCLIRQVLQHLSNAEIEKILHNAGKYKHLIVTEQYPNPSRKIMPNLDIPHGPDVRLHFDSAVFLDAPPFDLKNVKLLLDAEAEEGTRIKSFVVSGERSIRQN